MNGHALDFQPGTGTGYSPLADFDLLRWIIEIITGEMASSYLQRSIFDLMGMADNSYVWGLGMKIRQNPQRAGSPCTVGTYGRSGAFGTHFLVRPKDGLETVWVTNRAGLNGSRSYISQEIKEPVFCIFARGAAQ